MYSDHATLRGSLDSFGDSSYADVWFEWGPEGQGLPYDTNLGRKESLGWYAFDTWDGLSSGTYEYRAAGSNDWGKSEGYTRTFTI